MSDLDVLLVVQGLDTTIDQLRHRIETLPARRAIVDREAELASVDVTAAPVVARRDELARSQKRVEDEVAGLEVKIAEEDRRLYSGAITAARELQDLQTELDALRRRQGDLETEILEIMDLAEPVDAQLVAFDEQRSALRSELEALRAELASTEVELAAELGRVEAERAEAVTGVDAALLGTYADLRRQLGGTAVARLTGTTCGACHLGLSAVDIAHLRRLESGEVPTCPECGALLVV